MRVVTETTKFLKVAIPAGQTGIFKPVEPLALSAVARIRQVSVSADTHEKTTEISIRAGQHSIIDHLPDLQSFETAPHDRAENAPEIGQSEKIEAEAVVTSAYAANAIIIIAVTYWVVIP